MWTKQFWMETLERFIRGFATAFVLTASVAETVTGQGEQIELWDRLLIGFVQGLGSVALSLAGGQVGAKDSPALLPKKDDPPLPPPEGDGKEPEALLGVVPPNENLSARYNEHVDVHEPGDDDGV